MIKSFGLVGFFYQKCYPSINLLYFLFYYTPIEGMYVCMYIINFQNYNLY